MYPAYTQLVAKWSSPSICDARATGWEGVRVVRELRSRCLCIYRGRLRAGAEDFEFAIDYFKPKPTKLIPTIIITTITNIINNILIIT